MNRLRLVALRLTRLRGSPSGQSVVEVLLVVSILLLAIGLFSGPFARLFEAFAVQFRGLSWSLSMP